MHDGRECRILSIIDEGRRERMAFRGAQLKSEDALMAPAVASAAPSDAA